MNGLFRIVAHALVCPCTIWFAAVADAAYPERPMHVMLKPLLGKLAAELVMAIGATAE